MNILVVDDSKAMRMIVKRTVKKAGFKDHNFVEAENGKKALERITADPPPDLVLSDWNMPLMTGIELLEKLKEEGNTIKFGFVTSEGTQEMRDRATAAGALFLICKPFTVEAFVEALTPLID